MYEYVINDCLTICAHATNLLSIYKEKKILSSRVVALTFEI